MYSTNVILLFYQMCLIKYPVCKPRWQHVSRFGQSLMFGFCFYFRIFPQFSAISVFKTHHHNMFRMILNATRGESWSIKCLLFLLVKVRDIFFISG